MTAKGKNASPIKVQAVKSDLLNTTGQWVEETGASSMKGFRELGCSPVVGFQIRYIYLIDKTCEITVPILPFSKIKEMGASMYKGEKLCDVGVKRSTASFQDVGGGAIPTTSLHLNYA